MKPRAAKKVTRRVKFSLVEIEVRASDSATAVGALQACLHLASQGKSGTLKVNGFTSTVKVTR